MPTLQRHMVGHVTSAGKTAKAAIVRTTFQTYDRFLKTHSTIKRKFHISDPTNALHTHDVIRFSHFPYLSQSPNIAHTVTKIIAPWGPPLSKRPALLTAEERAARRALQVFKRGGEHKSRLQNGVSVLDEGGHVKTWTGRGKKQRGKKLGEELDRESVEAGKAAGKVGGRRKKVGVWYTGEDGNLRMVRPELLVVKKEVERRRAEDGTQEVEVLENGVEELKV